MLETMGVVQLLLSHRNPARNVSTAFLAKFILGLVYTVHVGWLQ